MRLIDIRTRLKPFTHQPGTRLLVPGSTCVVEAYPTLIRIDNKDYPIAHDGPVENFTVVQDLERFCVTIFSRSYCYHVTASGEIIDKKHPNTATYDGPRYDFGVSKKQLWDQIVTRCDVREFLPYWQRIGSLLSLCDQPIDYSGTFVLLRQCEEAIAAHRPEKIAPMFSNAFKACFEQVLIPRLLDTDHQGFLPFDAKASSSDPHYLLTIGAQLIRSLFLSSLGSELALLPNLPPELFAGRIVRERFSLGHISLRWQQKRLRMVHIEPTLSGELQLHLPSSIRRFRLHDLSLKKGVWCERGTALAISASRRYVLDRFER